MIRLDKLDFWRNAARSRWKTDGSPVRANQFLAVAQRERGPVAKALALFLSYFRFRGFSDVPGRPDDVSSRGKIGSGLPAAKMTRLILSGRERDSGGAIQHPEWTFRACGDVAIPLWGADEFWSEDNC